MSEMLSQKMKDTQLVPTPHAAGQTYAVVQLVVCFAFTVLVLFLASFYGK